MKKSLLIILAIVFCSNLSYTQNLNAFSTSITNAIDTSGNIGIGTTSPNFPLEVYGQSKFHGKVGIDSIATFSDTLIMMETSRAEEDLIINGDLIMNKYKITGLNSFRPASFNDAGELTTITDPCDRYGQGHIPYWRYGSGIIFIDCPDVKVGIGNSTPAQNLHVEGNGYFTNKLGIGIDSPVNELDVDGTGTFTEKLGIGTSTPTLELEIVGNGSISDKLGLGTNNPSKKFELNNGCILLSGTLGNDTGARFEIVDNTNTNNFMKFSNTDGDQFFIDKNGKVFAHEVEVKLGSFPDYVFDDDYNLMSLKELDSFIKTNRHLPEVPNENTVIEEGLNLGEMDAILLKKVEELTLYIISQQKQIEELKEEINSLTN